MKNAVPDFSGKMKTPVYRTFPLGQISPKGWLKKQVQLSADGFYSHLEDISEFLTAENGWLQWSTTLAEWSAKHEKQNPMYQDVAWEEQAYWVRGIYRLAILTGEQRLMDIAMRFINAMLDSVRENGYFGPECLLHAETDIGEIPDIWPHMVMLDVIKDYYLETGDERAVGLLSGFFHYCLSIPDDKFIPPRSVNFRDWTTQIQIDRCCEMVDIIQWLYEKTNDVKLPELIRRLYQVWMRDKPETYCGHVVNFAMRIKYPAYLYPMTGDRSWTDMSEQLYRNHMEKWGQMPGGLYAADENVREGKHDPRQGTETCAMLEIVKSFTRLAELTGETVYADRTEDIMFNSYPASHAPDYSGLHYLTCDNQPLLDAETHDYDNKGRQSQYSAFHYRCCQHNTGSGWPNYVASMFMRSGSKDDRIIAWTYGPCMLNADLGGNRIRISEETAYPFEETVRFRIEEGSVELFLRIPAWAERFELTVNGQKQTKAETDTHLVGTGILNTGDTVEIRFPQEPKYRHFPQNHNCVCLDMGPLTYSLKMKEEWIRAESNMDKAGIIWYDWDVKAVSPWNYALNLSKQVEVIRSDSVADQPFTPENAPVTLKTSGRKVKDWGMGELNTIMEVPDSPPEAVPVEETLEFIPLGCMRARISCLPYTEH